MTTRPFAERGRSLRCAFAVIALLATLGSCAARGSFDDRPDASSGAAPDGSPLAVCFGSTCIAPPAGDCGARSVTIQSGEVHLQSAGGCGASPVVTWTVDAGAAPDAWTPPTRETYACPPGDVRVHVRDMWSDQASPTLDVLTGRPLAVNLFDVDHAYTEYSAREDTAGCGWFSACVPASVTSFVMEAVGSANGCAVSQRSGVFGVGGASAPTADVWIDYLGASSSLQQDYTQSPAPVHPGAFQTTNDASTVGDAACPDAGPPVAPAGVLKVHFRWPWGDPSRSGFAGTACESMKLGYNTPPYPTSLKVQGLPGACGDLEATLDFQDSACPWYTLLLPDAAWSAGAPTITIAYPDWTAGLATPPIVLPSPPPAELWLAYAGPPDDSPTEGTACNDFSTRPDQYHVYSANPGPGYAHCGGDTTVTVDPCNPPLPAGYSPVHFRYLWAGQTTFTFFPKPDFMPRWIILEVSSGATTDEVTCFREQDRPWFNCPVPNADFAPSATWRADDKTRTPEWNTVQPRPFPAAPGEYWIRWDYGKPDTTTGTFKTFTDYPDGTGGDWSQTGNWNDQTCASKPPATPSPCGYQGWFPFRATGYAYPFGGSLAKVYADSSAVQDLLNTFVCERYEIWKKNYLETANLVCGPGTARVRTDPPQTVSEGQGYGIAISAAMGDKDTFDMLWNFVRNYLSQSAKKYCGGLMGWMWDGTVACRPVDQPCDPDSGGCGGNQDSAFDGDVDIGIGLVFAARQWPEYTGAAVDWLLKMECEVNTKYDGQYNYPAPGDTFDKNCQGYPGQPCSYTPGANGSVFLNYDPPGYFRVFGDFLAASLDPATYSDLDREYHRTFWYDTARTVYKMVESCYDQVGVDPGLSTDKGTYAAPCSVSIDNYNWSRFSWRLGVDAAWFGNRLDLPENAPGSSSHYAPETQMQAKIDNIQQFYNGFFVNNPPEAHANRFSTICQNLFPDGAVQNCTPALGHNSYFVNTAMSAYVSVFDDRGQTTGSIRQEALEESVSTTVENDRYYQESLGVYTMLFLSGNFPNPMNVP